MTQAAALAAYGSNSPSNRNRIINGDMRIDQRNAGASVTAPNGGYTLDRWATLSSAASKFTIQQNAGSVTPPAGFSNYAGLTVTSAYSPTGGELFALRQRIEGLNVSDLAWGTASAKTITISFWVRSSLTGTFGGSLQNSTSTRSYPFTYSISVANTWEQKTVTVSGDTTGTWLTSNGVGISMTFSIGAGSSILGTADEWAGAAYYSATGSTNLIATNGATFYVTGVQLEAGSVATPFEHRQYGQELALCQRYYVRLQDATGTTNSLCTVQIEGSTNANAALSYAMRAAPSSTFSGLTISDSSVIPAITSVSSISSNTNGIGFTVSCSAGTLNSGRAGRIRIAGSGTAYIDFSAEL